MDRNDILRGEVRPSLKPIDPDRIPEAMRLEPRWVRWNWSRVKGKWTKKPVGSVTDRGNWGSFNATFERYLSGECEGVGFVFGDGWSGIDLDESRDENGDLSQLAQEIIAAVDSYVEVSPTQTGVKIYLRGSLPQGIGTKNKAGTLEVYSWGRYFCVTGEAISGDIADRQLELEAMHARYVAREAKPSPVPTPSPAGTGTAGPAVEAMRRIKPSKSENDGTNRLFAYTCRAVEHNLSDADAIAAIRTVALEHPFPISYTDGEIVTRIRDAEKRTTRGTAKRSIYVGTDIPKTISECVSALADSDVYQHLGRLTTIIHNPPKCKYAIEDNGAPRLAFISRDGMLEAMTAAADYFCHDGRSGGTKATTPKAELRNAVYARGSYPGVRSIYGVVCRPILLPTGEIITSHGYHADSGLYVHIEGEWPAPMSTDSAVAKLRDVWSDFPFASPASEAGCFAAFLTLLCRRMLAGNTPLFMVDGNRSRVGKGLLTDTWTTIADGRRASRYSLSSQDELRKYLTSLAIQGGDYVCFDNVSSRLGGATLEAAMTAGKITDRILCQSENIDVPLPICWFGTANNCTYSSDMPGRTVPIKLDSTVPNPSERGGFRHPALLSHIEANRRELLIAGLSIVAHYIANGSPQQSIPNFGGFEAWSNLIRSAVVHAGLADPLADRELLAEGQDVESDVQRLHSAWSFDKATTIGDAVKAVADGKSHLTLRSILEGCDEKKTPQERLGKLLRNARGITIDGKKFDHDGKKPPKWSLINA